MRVIVLAVLTTAAFWAFDAHEYDGRYSHELWRQPPLAVNTFQIKCSAK